MHSANQSGDCCTVKHARADRLSIVLSRDKIVVFRCAEGLFQIRVKQSNTRIHNRNPDTVATGHWPGCTQIEIQAQFLALGIPLIQIPLVFEKRIIGHARVGLSRFEGLRLHRISRDNVRSSRKTLTPQEGIHRRAHLQKIGVGMRQRFQWHPIQEGFKVRKVCFRNDMHDQTAIHFRGMLRIWRCKDPYLGG